MSKLIAMVPTAVRVNGERVIIQPGQALPELSPHDARELTVSGMAENQEDKAALAAAAAKTTKASAAEFEAARQRVRQAQESTKPPAGDDSKASGDTEPQGDSQAAADAKTKGAKTKGAKPKTPAAQDTAPAETK
jgi:hypothetical protein